jgi:hypothetical protein
MGAAAPHNVVDAELLQEAQLRVVLVQRDIGADAYTHRTVSLLADPTLAAAAGPSRSPVHRLDQRL